MLSFKNLVELHVLAVLRREKRVPLADVRKAIATLQKHVGEPHPLLSRKLLADESRRLFVEILDQLIHVKDGQVQMRETSSSTLRASTATTTASPFVSSRSRLRARQRQRAPSPSIPLCSSASPAFWNTHRDDDPRRTHQGR